MWATSFSARLTARAENLLARLIGESTAAERLAAELGDASFTVEVEGLSLGIELRAIGGRIGFRPFWIPPAAARDSAGAASQPSAAARAGAPGVPRRRAATLRATPADLLRLLRGHGLADLRGTHAELGGSLEVAEKFAALFRLARPDLEEEIARWIGDYAAHELGGLARGAYAWIRRAADALASDTAEYLQEESAALPAAIEARAFYADVERLRDDVERAGERLRRLAARRALV